MKINQYLKLPQAQHYRQTILSLLWKTLSDILGENISKSNFRTSLQRCKFTNVSPIRQAFTVVNNINLCGKTQNNLTLENKNIAPITVQNSIKCQYLEDAPRPNYFYGRTSELATLQQWIIEEDHQIVALVGIAGIGKTALARHLISQIQDDFDCIIWRNLHISPSRETTLKNILKLITHKSELELPTKISDQLELLLKCLRNQRCLIILDH